ncbi:MAG: HlyD family efflux transporter periplasmic adaptor subunit [Planctomycetaceae bacterium]
MTTSAPSPNADRLPTRESDDERAFFHRFQEFCREAHQDPAWTTTPSTLAHEYQRLFLTDRTWLLTPRGRQWRVTAVSGVPGFQRRAETVQRLEQLARQVANAGPAFCWEAGSEAPVSPRLGRLLEQYLDEAHVCRLRIEHLMPAQPEPLSPAEKRAQRKRPIGLVVCEWFQPPQADVEEADWSAARQQASLALQEAYDWSRAPLARWLRARRRSRNWFATARRGIMALIVIAALTALAALPVDYTIDAVGELQPVNRRHVFATADGIVKQINATTGKIVEAGDVLLTLESPELELEQRRVSGELQTTEKRIAALEASRLDFRSETSDSVSQLNVLAGDLSEQLQKRDNLRLELELLELRRGDLQMASPISGQIVTWDLERLLGNRPVARGQRLLTVADSHGPWQLELRVADDDVTDLSAAVQQQHDVPLDYIVVTMPGDIQTTKVRSISETVEVRQQGDPPSLLCLADAPEATAETAVPGLGVRARIHCGRTPAIVFGFRKLWRAVQEHVLFPWGW